MGKLFVMVFAAPCSHDKSCQNLHPDTRTYPQYKSCNVTDFWLRSNLYRDTAQVLICNICYILTDLFHLSNLYRDTPGFDKTCTWICKNHAIPSSHPRLRSASPGHGGTAFRLKYQDRDRMRRRVTQPPHIAGPLGDITGKK